MDKTMCDGAGAVLGPHEALWAELMWLGESVAAAKRNNREIESAALIAVPKIPRAVKRRVLSTALLYGTLNTSALGPSSRDCLEVAIFAAGGRTSMREWHGERDPFKGWAPFVRFSSEPYRLGDLLTDRFNQAPTPAPVRRVIERTLTDLGITSYSQPMTPDWTPDGNYRISVKEHVDLHLAGMTWPPEPTLGMTRPGRLALGAHHALQYSIDHSLPYVSKDELAPEWNQQNQRDPRFAIVKAVLDLPDGPTLPKSLYAIHSLQDDKRLSNLRAYVDLVVNRVLTQGADPGLEVRREAARVARRNDQVKLAGRVSRITTYVGLPVGVAEALAGASGPGLTLGVVGFLAEGLTDLIQRSRRNHWTSL